MNQENKTLVTAEKIKNAVENLEGWEYLETEKTLQCVWTFEKFVPTMAFVRALTEIMDAENHHSDIILDSRAKQLTVRVTTHSANAVTQADLNFAQAVASVK